MFLQVHLLESLYSDTVYVYACIYKLINVHVSPQVTLNYLILGLILDFLKILLDFGIHGIVCMYSSIVLLACLSFLFVLYTYIRIDTQHWWKGTQIHNLYYRWLKRLTLLNHHKAFFLCWNISSLKCPNRQYLLYITQLSICSHICKYYCHL